MITTTDSLGNSCLDGVEKRSTADAWTAPSTTPHGEDFIFPYIALAARKLATEMLSISNCLASIYKQL